jgi:hypothetical protein
VINDVSSCDLYEIDISWCFVAGLLDALYNVEWTSNRRINLKKMHFNNL